MYRGGGFKWPWMGVEKRVGKKIGKQKKEKK